MTEIIIPTPGRIVWYWPSAADGIANLPGAPLAAIVAGVHDDRLINLAVFDSYGNTQQRSSVRLVQPGDDIPNSSYASWMPYQIGQAPKIIKLPVVDTPVETSIGDMFAESNGASASEIGLVGAQADTAAPEASELEK